MKRSTALVLTGIVIAAVGFGHAQTEAPKNLAGAKFPCTYTQPPAPYRLTAKFLETIGDSTYATGIEIRSDNLTIRSENAVCHGNGECEMTGKVTVTLAGQKSQIK